jgi:hypothetical protein
MLLLASSPYAKRGELYGAFRRHYGKDNARVLVWKADTAAMNPSIDPAIIAEAYESDPEAARAEYGAEFRDDLADFATREQVDAVTMWGRRELPPEPGVVYVAFCDPSGGVSDAMTLAIAHLDRHSVCVLDAVLEIRPPFDPEAAVRECAALLRRYGVATVIGDKYAGEWPVARFREQGIAFVQSARPKSALYGDLLPLINARRIELLDLPRLAHELAGLERRTSRAGRDSIDHTPGGHDDLANAVAGVLVGIDLDRRPALVNLKETIGVEPTPAFLNGLFLTVVDAGPDLAAVFWGSDDREGSAIYILDVDVVYFRPGLFRELALRLNRLEARRFTTHIFVPEHLAPQAAVNDGAPVLTLPHGFDPALYLLPAAVLMGRGLVRFCPPVIDKMQTEAIAAALALRAGDPVETVLRAALISSIALKHMSASMFEPFQKKAQILVG